MEKPKRASCNVKRGTSDLYWGHDDSKEFYLRGGIFWPEMDSNGFAVLGGHEIRTNKVWIFQECEFLVVEDVRGNNQAIKYHGISHFFNKAWSKYFCRLFFWTQSDATYERFRLQIYRSQTIKPAPGFLEVSLADKDEARHIVYEHIQTDRLTLDKDSELARQLEFARLDTDAQLPAVEALGRLLAGLQRFPFAREHVEEEDIDIF